MKALFLKTIFKFPLFSLFNDFKQKWSLNKNVKKGIERIAEVSYQNFYSSLTSHTSELRQASGEIKKYPELLRIGTKWEYPELSQITQN